MLMSQTSPALYKTPVKDCAARYSSLAAYILGVCVAAISHRAAVVQIRKHRVTDYGAACICVECDVLRVRITFRLRVT